MAHSSTGTATAPEPGHDVAGPRVATAQEGEHGDHDLAQGEHELR